MAWCRVALITVFVVLLQFEVHHATKCNNRRTVIQIRIPGKTSVNIKFPSKSDPVKFAPYPSQNNNSECYICVGSRCRKCTTDESQTSSSNTSQARNAQRTNILIDLQKHKSKPQNDTTTSSSNDTDSSTGDIQPQEGPVFVMQDTSSASSASNSNSTNKNKKGGQIATSSSSVAVAITDVIASFVNNSDSTVNYYVGDDANSTAGSSASSRVENNQNSPDPDPKPEPSPPPLPVPVPSNKSSTSKSNDETIFAAAAKTLSGIFGGATEMAGEAEAMTEKSV